MTEIEDLDVMRLVLETWLPELGMELPPDTCDKLCDFGRAVMEQNQVMNLTAITDPEQFAKLHLLDSLTVLTCEDLAGRTVIDVGCGAGFPGVPIAVACPEAKVTLLDSLGKRIHWLGEVLPRMGIPAELVNARAEEEAARHRETYDVAVSRAVARLNVLLELLAPFVRIGGTVLAMKGEHAAEEVNEAESAAKKLGLRLEGIRTFRVSGVNHVILVYRKVAPTPSGYPRRYSKIKQSPL